MKLGLMRNKKAKGWINIEQVLSIGKHNNFHTSKTTYMMRKDDYRVRNIKQ